MNYQPTYPEIRLILGDQLNPNHSWFTKTKTPVLYVMMEVVPEATYVKHHIQKIMAVFSAMRAFADKLKDRGHHVYYFSISDENNQQSFKENLLYLIDRFNIGKACFQEPDEYRLDKHLDEVFSSLPVTTEKVSSEHFFTERFELKQRFEGKKQYLMESFYRQMRKKHGILMEDASRPITGKWNYDAENRKKLPADHQVPEPMLFKHDVRDIFEEVKSMGIPWFGELNPQAMIWPKSRKEALQLLDYFLEELLPYFGTYQDALSNDFWSLYHSRISFALNVKMINPKEVIRMVEAAWQDDPKRISIAQAEGFIRQVVGWREYMRGIYWAEMPGFAALNYFGSKGKLPDYFWTGNTKMNCVSVAVRQSLQHAYAHHIQRLMITGNFCSLAGIDPDETDLWYMGIYIDAFDWVEITNTRGMSQFADGGIVGTKPYVSSASYIHKMGDHCGSCHYDHKKKTGDKACPFNSLYWHFLHRNREKLSSNQRMSMMYRVLDKMDEDNLQATLKQADTYLSEIEEL